MRVPLTNLEQSDLLLYRSGRLRSMTQEEAWALLTRYPAQEHDEVVLTSWDHLSFPEAIAVVEAEIRGGPCYVPELDRLLPPPPVPRFNPDDDPTPPRRHRV